ncbi:MAG TPA: SDR family oxidoreductase [Anaerolineaceae bacterium]
MGKQRKSSKWLVNLGFLVLGYAVWQQINRRASSNPRQAGPAPKKPGWAVVTGASSGIGLEFARQLAPRGYNLVLVARREGRLQALAAEMERDWGISTHVVAADLSNEDGVTRVEGVIKNTPDLVMLVNNAGFGVEGSFVDGELDDQIKMVDVHVLAPVQLTRAALPAMLACRSGSIMNVSSISAFVPGPTSITYSSTKAYLNNFTSALFMEYRGSGLKFQALCPGFTVTEFHDKLEGSRRSRLPRFMWMSAVEVVRQSLSALDGGPVVFIPGWINRAIALVARTPLLTPFVWLGSAMVRR